MRRVVSLEGFGIPAESAEIAPAKIVKWLDALGAVPEFKPYVPADSKEPEFTFS